jgi:hypothetical protein
VGFALLEHSGLDRIDPGEPGKYDSLTGYNITISYLAYDPQYPCSSSAVAQVQVRTMWPESSAHTARKRCTRFGTGLCCDSSHCGCGGSAPIARNRTLKPARLGLAGSPLVCRCNKPTAVHSLLQLLGLVTNGIANVLLPLWYVFVSFLRSRRTVVRPPMAQRLHDSGPLPPHLHRDRDWGSPMPHLLWSRMGVLFGTGGG